jgi:hypothetical protein
MAQIYDVSYTPRQAVGSVGKSSTHGGGEAGLERRRYTTSSCFAAKINAE